MDVWVAFIAMEVAEQNFDAARSIYKRCYSYKLEDGGQVRCRQSRAMPKGSVPGTAGGGRAHILPGMLRLAELGVPYSLNCEDWVHACRRPFARHGCALSASLAVRMTTCRLS